MQQKNQERNGTEFLDVTASAVLRALRDALTEALGDGGRIVHTQPLRLPDPKPRRIHTMWTVERDSRAASLARQGRTFAEVAQAVGCSPGAAQFRLRMLLPREEYRNVLSVSNGGKPVRRSPLSRRIWDKEEIRRALALADQGKTAMQIGEAVQRPRRSVMSKLEREMSREMFDTWRQVAGEKWAQ